MPVKSLIILALGLCMIPQLASAQPCDMMQEHQELTQIYARIMQNATTLEQANEVTKLSNLFIEGQQSQIDNDSKKGCQIYQKIRHELSRLSETPQNKK